MRLRLIMLVVLLLLPLCALAITPNRDSLKYESDTLTIEISCVQKRIGSERLTYFVAEIWVHSPSQIVSAFAKDKYKIKNGEHVKNLRFVILRYWRLTVITVTILILAK